MNQNDNSSLYADLFMLDLSSNFSTDSPPFQLIAPNATYATSPDGYSLSTCAAGGKQNPNKIFWFGGIYGVYSAIGIQNVLYSVDISTLSFDSKLQTITETGTRPSPRYSSSSVMDDSGKWYIFGGYTGIKVPSNDTTMYVFDTTTSTWSSRPFHNFNLDPNLMPGAEFTATLLSDGRIVYLGGVVANKSANANFNKIWIYDTKKDEWNMTIAQGGDGIPRLSHSAVLTSDERIIIFGGNTNGQLSSTNALFVLDTKTFTWSQPNTIVSPSSIAYEHSAVLYGNYMIIAFGIYPNAKSNANFGILDISNKDSFTWVSDFSGDSSNTTSGSSPSPTSSTTSQDNSKGAKKGLIIGLVVPCGVVVLAAISIGLYCIFVRDRSQVV